MTTIRLLILSLCLGAALMSGCQKNPEPVETKVEPNPGTSEPELWWNNLDDALERASRESKPVLIDFVADCCKPCKRMHAEVFPVDIIEKRLRSDFVPVLIDATDVTPQISKLLRAYRVGTLPTIVFLNAKGKFLTDQSLVGFTEVDKLEERLAQVVKLTSAP